MTRSDVIEARMKLRGFQLWMTGLGGDYRHVIGPNDERFGILKLTECAARFLDGEQVPPHIDALSKTPASPSSGAAMKDALTGREAPVSRGARASLISSTTKKARR